jgi:FMN phosphatase YigB (HAD superfamily)
MREFHVSRTKESVGCKRVPRAIIENIIRKGTTFGLIMMPIHYPTILFDWGDTVMKDDPTSNVPMVEWETVEIIPGIESVLAYLQASGRRIVLATSASISTESQIRAALGRVGLDKYFSRIFCFENTGLPKGVGFYRHILDHLGIPASEALMVGDSFEKDVLDSNSIGIHAVWFNLRSEETQSSEMHVTVHSMEESLSFFKSLDQ